MLRSILPSLLFSVTIARSMEMPVIPLPKEVKQSDGTLLLSGNLKIQPRNHTKPGMVEIAINEAIRSNGLDMNGPEVPLILEPSPVPSDRSDEAYQLIVSTKGIIIRGSELGLFRGATTLSQLMESAAKDSGKVSLACLQINDSPRFGWRGFMLDESRHFTGEKSLKLLIDAMAHYKLNRLHWHLTDSPGWRIEIRKYPELTRIGGRGSETDRSPTAKAEFYTQDQVRDIVAYAKARGVSIIPEIDMPGHADAAVKAYPEHDGGGFDKWPKFTFNPAKIETLTFLDDILTEVAGLFPDAGVIHLGGDEVNFGWKNWTNLPEVQSVMKKENLKDLAEVEKGFNRRMAGTINKLGFKTGGWDEIASCDLPADKTLVWWWRHDKPQVLKDTLAAGYPVVLCPRRPCYFDFLQEENHNTGRRWGGINTLAETYQFPASLKLSPADEAKVVGIEACLWTETARTQARRDFLTWPRLVALAEAGWTVESGKDLTSFEARLKPQLPWLKSHGITPYDPFAKSPEITDKGQKSDYLDKPEDK